MFEEEKPSLWDKIKRSKIWLPTVVLAIAIGATVALLASKPEVEEEKHEFPPLVVEVSEASLDEKLRSSVFQGEVRAKTNIAIVTQVTGKVTQVSDKFIEGGQFAANEIILQIDDADYRVALKSAEAAVAEAQVQLDIELASAETSKKEWRDLVGESLEKANPLRLNQPQVQRARARLDAARAQLAQAELDFERTRVRAPFAGRVLSKAAELGQFVSRGNSIGRMFSTDLVEIRIPMSDLQISELGLGLGQIPSDREKIAATVRAKFGNKFHAWNGYLKSVDASVDNETRLLFGTIVVESPFAQSSTQSIPLAPGLFVDVELNAAEKVAGVSVPRTALRSGNQVYVVQDKTLRFKEVETLFTSPEVAVLSALKSDSLLPGDLVVTSPVPGAFDGMAVEIKDVVDDGLKAVEAEAAETELEPAAEDGSATDAGATASATAS